MFYVLASCKCWSPLIAQAGLASPKFIKTAMGFVSGVGLVLGFAFRFLCWFLLQVERVRLIRMVVDRQLAHVEI